MAVEARQRQGAIDGYAPPAERPPLGAYAALTALFNAGFGAGMVVAARSGRLPERIGAGDVILLGTASHKLSRLISKDKVTAFLRAPFTEYQGSGGPGELEERPRGSGLRRGVGELVACPYCIGLWVSGGFHLSLLWAPRLTRVLASTFTALTVSDFLQIAYKAAEEKGLGES
jgi:hypothetical protein